MTDTDSHHLNLTLQRHERGVLLWPVRRRAAGTPAWPNVAARYGKAGREGRDVVGSSLGENSRVGTGATGTIGRYSLSITTMDCSSVFSGVPVRGSSVYSGRNITRPVVVGSLCTSDVEEANVAALRPERLVLQKGNKNNNNSSLDFPQKASTQKKTSVRLNQESGDGRWRHLGLEGV